MSRDLTSLATRYAGRPLLLTPRAAQELADRVRAVDHGAAVREGRFQALIRKLSGGRDRERLAMDDDGEGPSFGERAAYAPRYVGEPEDYGFCWSLSDGVALINIEGPLLDRGEAFCGEIYHGYDTILAALREASADERVRGIFVREATPGGLVAGGLPALAQWMRENGARAGGKPIWVHADMACSAGYWMAAAADRITAPRVGLVGSIGAVIVHENWAAGLEKMGVEITAIQFGAKKTAGAWWEALSDTARADLEAEIDQVGRDFVADVIAGRPQLSVEEVVATEAGVFMGHHDEAARSALELKLIDAHASEEEAFAELREHVANGARTPSTPATGTSTAGAPRGRASASAAKEADMAKKPQAGGRPSRAAAALVAAQAAVRKAQADLKRAEAAAEEDGDENDQVDEEDADPAPAAAEGDEGDDQDETDAMDEDEDEPADDAKAIAASAEAKTHPALAMTAISTGQTLAQFKANVAAAGGGRHQLQATLGGRPRLGADASVGGKAASAGASRRSAADTFARNTQAGLKQHGRLRG